VKKDWSYDSPLISKANTAADFMFLNIVYLVCCLPIVTIGPASAAMAGVTAAFIRGDASGVAVFWKLFCCNLKSFLFPWLGIMALGVMILFDAYLLFAHHVSGVVFFAIVLALLLVIYAMILAHVFMIHARFECGFRYMISNSVLLTLAHPLRTVLILIIRLLPFACFFFWPQMFVFMTPVWLLCYCSLGGYVSVRIMQPVYDRLLNSKEK